LSSEITTAANAHLLESSLDSWLKNNHITMEIIIFCFGDSLSYIQCNFFAMYKSSHVYNLPATYHHLAHYYLRSLLVSGVFYELQFPNLFLNGIDPEMNRHSIFFRLASKVLDNARHFT